MSALGKLALPSSRPVFVEGLNDESKWVRTAALGGLFAIDDPGVIGVCERNYRSGSWVVKHNALYWLERAENREESLEALSRLLETERSWRWRRRIKKVILRK